MGIAAVLKSLGLIQPRNELEAARRQQAEAAEVHRDKAKQAKDQTSDALAQFIHDINHTKMREIARRGE